MMKWLKNWFRRNPEIDDQPEVSGRAAFAKAMRNQGYRRIFEGVSFEENFRDYPPREAPIWAHRFEWGAPAVIVLSELSPEFNVAGLWWKPANGPVVDHEAHDPANVIDAGSSTEGQSAVLSKIR